MSMRLKINGEDRVSTSDPLSPLVDVLRDEFFLTGAKPVCREGFCGACMVLLEGKPVASCLMPAGLVTDREVRTVEALAPEGDLSPLQRALEQHDVVQCGMCFPGMLVSLTSYFEQAENPNRRRDREPFTNFAVVLAATENDTADSVTPASAGSCHDALAILTSIQPFKLPQIRLHAAILEFPNGFDHQARPQLKIIDPLVAGQPVELHLLCWNQKLEHEAAAAPRSEKLGQALQAGRLPFVQRAIAFRVVAHQNFAEGWIERCNVACEILAILEIEFVLSAFLRRASGDDIPGRGVAQDGGAKLLVDKDARLILRYAAGERCKKAIVDDSFGSGDLRRLRIA
jgi:carbon-monoxide dehydrogenase small subunit